MYVIKLDRERERERDDSLFIFLGKTATVGLLTLSKITELNNLHAKLIIFY